VLSRLSSDGEKLAHLLAAARKEASPVDRRCRAKRLAHEAEAIENFRVFDA
jgi:hypothetical protein